MLVDYGYASCQIVRPKSLTKFVRENEAQGAVAHTDGWTGYDLLQGTRVTCINLW